LGGKEEEESILISKNEVVDFNGALEYFNKTQTVYVIQNSGIETVKCQTSISFINLSINLEMKEL
jgi:hypothetical protein